ncbi:RICIN domain-containing protein [Streptomyces yaizuensis]|uniref:Ricin B lectin domain-containing protein n=1 Tax=Streptomyces yaizuensis TaxID=2989713 RepID=A0ABQ5P451_9ACTN|nr:hypothetical protein [Streptomyces sp. YSPA8]GLF97265.1 hypothetical protein SYYSPA8_23230 [Streptomyces sp. YSPA8]
MVALPAAHAAKQDPLVVLDVGVPGERSGGRLEFDGSADDDLSAHGVYGIVYSNNKRQAACTGIDGPDIDPFEEATHKKWRRSRDEFTPTGPVQNLEPGASANVRSEQSRTSSWSVSMATEVSSGAEWIASIKVTTTATYGEELTVAEGQETTAANPTSDMIQRVAMGMMHDVWAVQIQPWRYTWRTAGDTVLVGDTAKNFAERHTVPRTGCYKTGYFRSLKVPASVGFGIVEQYPKDQSRPDCPFRIEGDDVSLYPGRTVIVDGSETVEPDLDADKEKYAIPEGTCVRRSDGTADKVVDDTDKDGRVTGRSAWVELATWERKGKKCRGPFKESCDENFWVSTNDVDGFEVAPLPLVTWGDQDTFTITSSLGRDGTLTVPEADDNYYDNDVAFASFHDDTWQTIRKGEGLWQLKVKNTHHTRNGQCLLIGERNRPGRLYGQGGKVAECGEGTEQHFRILHNGRDAFSLQSQDSPGTCLAVQAGRTITVTSPCDATGDGPLWTFAKR